MTRTHAIKRLLEHGPLQMESIQLIMGGDREGVRQDVRDMLGSGEVYNSLGWYQLNRPNRHGESRRTTRAVPLPKAQNDFALQAVW